MSWVVLRDVALGRGVDGVPSRICFALLHPERGIVLLDLSPKRTPDAVGQARRALAAASFPAIFAGHLPIVYLTLAQEEVPRLGAVMDAAFAEEEAVGLHGGWAWTGLAKRVLDGELAAHVVQLDENRDWSSVLGLPPGSEESREAARPPGLRALGYFWLAVLGVAGGGAGLLQHMHVSLVRADSQGGAMRASAADPDIQTGVASVGKRWPPLADDASPRVASGSPASLAGGPVAKMPESGVPPPAWPANDAPPPAPSRATPPDAALVRFGADHLGAAPPERPDGLQRPALGGGRQPAAGAAAPSTGAVAAASPDAAEGTEPRSATEDRNAQPRLPREEVQRSSATADGVEKEPALPPDATVGPAARPGPERGAPDADLAPAETAPSAYAAGSPAGPAPASPRTSPARGAALSHQAPASRDDDDDEASVAARVALAEEGRAAAVEAPVAPPQEPALLAPDRPEPPLPPGEPPAHAGANDRLVDISLIPPQPVVPEPPGPLDLSMSPAEPIAPAGEAHAGAEMASTTDPSTPGQGAFAAPAAGAAPDVAPHTEARDLPAAAAPELAAPPDVAAQQPVVRREPAKALLGGAPHRAARVTEDGAPLSVSRCRAIVAKSQIGEALTQADLLQLRSGCDARR